MPVAAASSLSRPYATPHGAPRVVAFGECMLELRGEAFGALHQGYGGDTLNTAVYLQRSAGAALQVGYATALGDDALSAGLLSRWADEGLDLDAVSRLPGKLPGLYQISVDAQGERSFHYWRGQAAARAYFDGPDGSSPLEQQAASLHALYFSGISLAILPPAGRERLLALAAHLRHSGRHVVFDNNYRARLWTSADEAREAYTRACALATLALVTLDDEQALWGQDAEAQLAQTLALPCAEVVVKRGAAPTLVRVAGQAVQTVATQPVARVVDTTAAGDSFAGAYLASRLTGASAAEAAAAGNALAAVVVQHPGALIPREAMPAAPRG